MKTKKNGDKAFKSAKKYIDALSAKYSKLNIIRIDLAYKKPYSDAITLEDANSDFNHMMNNRRSKPSIFKEQVGYICKKEYTKDKGVHLHTFFFFDGQKVKKDAYKADQIGQYWQKEITKEKGCFHNCNRNEYKFKGIGMLDHKDNDKRKILDKLAIKYLSKEKKVQLSGADKEFTRGTMPKEKANVGRPRTNKKD